MRPARFKTVLIPIFLFISGSLYLISQNHYQIRNTLSYATRPIWDKDEAPSNVISHYWADGMVPDEYLCQLHGWKERPNVKKVKVLDAILFSSELDLLEIRMEELDTVVDRFFILESNATFTGLPKETYFANNRKRFERFEKKISYRLFPGYPLQPGEAAFDVEAKTRDAMTSFIRSHTTEWHPDVLPLILMSDVDEIPHAHTLMLLRQCEFGDAIHLQLKNYLYSFEWFIGYNSWRASVQKWLKGSYYRHSKSTENILADSGWHCSYCFRTISEYIIKMQGFSHSDRIGGKTELLDPGRIQNTICKGKDIFGMLPEAYSYRDLLSQMNLEPSKSAVGLPKHLLLNKDRFKFLLPGGCQRSDTSYSMPTASSNAEDEHEDAGEEDGEDDLE